MLHYLSLKKLNLAYNKSPLSDADSYEDPTSSAVMSHSASLNFTPLMRAAAQGSLDELRKLLEATGPTKALFDVDSKGRTALDWARMARKMDNIAFLLDVMREYINMARLEEIEQVNPTRSTALEENNRLARELSAAIHSRSVDAVMQIFSKNTLARAAVLEYEGAVYFTDVETPAGDTPLILAAGYNMLPVVTDLIANGCEVNHANKYGHTALTWACMCGHGEMVRNLVLMGANINHRTREGRTGLHYACLYAKARVVQVIMEILYERFCAWRDETTSKKFNAIRWTKYAATMERYINLVDDNGDTAMDLLPPMSLGAIVERVSKEEVEALKRLLRHRKGAESNIALSIYSENSGEFVESRSVPDIIETLSDMYLEESKGSAPVEITSPKSRSNTRTAMEFDKETQAPEEVRPERAKNKDSSADNLEDEAEKIVDDLARAVADSDGDTASVFGSEAALGSAENLAGVRDDDASIQTSEIAAKPAVAIEGEGVSVMDTAPNASPRGNVAVAATGGFEVVVDGAEADWGAFHDRENTDEDAESKRLEHFKGHQLGDMRAPSELYLIEIGGQKHDLAPVTPANKDGLMDRSDSKQITHSEDTEEKFDAVKLIGQMVSSLQVRSAMSLDHEVGTILHILAEASRRIKLWRDCVVAEAKADAPVLCWLGCGYQGSFRETSIHCARQCLHRPAECPDCHHVYQARILPEHRKECAKRIVSCLNSWAGCRARMPFDYLETHLNLRCQYRLINCRFDCGSKIQFRLFEDHEKYFCKKRITQCWQCHDNVWAGDMPKHLRDDCSERLLKCTVGCGDVIKAKDFVHHETEVCVQACKWGCNLRIGPAAKRIYHELSECFYRPAACPNKCGEDDGLVSGHVTEHTRHHCKLTLLACPNMCSRRKLFRNEIPSHLDERIGDCPERRIKCPSNLVGWRVSVKNDEIEEQSGIVIDYMRFPDKDGDKEAPLLSSLMTCLPIGAALPMPPNKMFSGVDKIRVRFADKNVWVDYWKSTIVAHERVTGEKIGQNPSTASNLECGYIRACEFNTHLLEDCPNRSVWIGRLSEAEEVIKKHRSPVNQGSVKTADRTNKRGKMKRRENSLFSNVNMDDISYCIEIAPQANEPFEDYPSQISKVKDSLQAAVERSATNEFVNAPKGTQICEYCSSQIPIERFKLHASKECGHILCRCGYGCGQQIIRIKLDDHMQNECPKRYVLCPLCKDQLWADELDSHVASECLERIAPCPLGCGDPNLIAKDIEDHVVHSCSNRMIMCRCGARLRQCDWSYHNIEDCAKKLVICPQGCGEQILMDIVEHHIEFDCNLKQRYLERPIRCPIGCGLRLRYIDCMEHVSLQCPRRLLDCPFKCGAVVRFEKMDVHLILCPFREISCEKGVGCCNMPLYMWFRSRRPPKSRGATATASGFQRIPTPYEDMVNTLRSGPHRDAITMGENFEGDNPIVLYTGGSRTRMSTRALRTAFNEVIETRKSAKQVTFSSKPSMKRPDTKGGFIDDDSLQPIEINTNYDSSLGDSESLTRLSSQINDPSATPLGTRRSRTRGTALGSITWSQEDISSVERAPLLDVASAFDASITYSAGVVCFKDFLSLVPCERHKRTLLMYCVRYNDFILADFVLSKCASEDLDLENIYGDTALTFCARQNKLKFIQLLIASSVNPDKETESGRTALIDAVKANNSEATDYLATNGATISLKTLRHAKSAVDWGKLVGNYKVRHILEIGLRVQKQIGEIFAAIPLGDTETVRKIVDGGDPFTPLNTTMFRCQMEKNLDLEVELLKEVDLKRALVQDQVKVIESISGLTGNAKRSLDKAHDDVQNLLFEQTELSKSMVSIFSSFESLASRIVPHDLIEIVTLKSPPKLVHLAGLAFGLLIGATLETSTNYDVSPSHICVWWPRVVAVLNEAAVTVRRIQSFSYAMLLSPSAASLLEQIKHIKLQMDIIVSDSVSREERDRIDREAKRAEVLAELNAARRDRRQQLQATLDARRREDEEVKRREQKVLEHVRRRSMLSAAPKKSLAITHRKFGADDQSLEKDATRVKVDALLELVQATAEIPQSKGVPQLPKPPPINEAGSEIDEIDDMDWDSDAEGQGEGSWVGGQWIAKPFTKKKEWWRRKNSVRTEKADESASDHDDAISALHPASSSRSRAESFAGALPSISTTSVGETGDGGTGGRRVSVMSALGEMRDFAAPRRKSSVNKLVFLDSESRSSIINPSKETIINDRGQEEEVKGDNEDIEREIQSLMEEITFVALPDDEEDEMRRAEDPANLNFVRLIQELVNCTCKLASDVPRFNSLTIAVREAQRALQNTIASTASDLNRARMEENRLEILNKELEDIEEKVEAAKRNSEMYQNKLRIARLMNYVLPSGHTAISWAATFGNEDIVDTLISRGAPVGYTENLTHLSASVIQLSYRLYISTYHGQRARIVRKLRLKKEEQAIKDGTTLEAIELNEVLSFPDHYSDEDIDRALAEKKEKEVHDALVYGGEGIDAGAKIIEKIFVTKSQLQVVLSSLKRLRSKLRLPIPEAAFNGHFYVINRIYQRGLFHLPMSSSWMPISAPFPRPYPVMELLDPTLEDRKRHRQPKIEIHEILKLANEAFSSSCLVEKIGWVDEYHPMSVFQESKREIELTLRKVYKKRDDFKAERNRLRLLRHELRYQKRYNQLMTRAIHSANFYRAMELVRSGYCSIDFETDKGMTALIMASEENTESVDHSLLLNEARETVLAVVFLLDRDEFKPAIDHETKFGDTALLHACSQGRTKIIEALLDRGAHIDRQNKFGQTALHIAVTNGSTRCVRLLLERGANPTIPSAKGVLAEDVAYENNQSDILALIGQFRAGFLGPATIARGRAIDAKLCPFGCSALIMHHEMAQHEQECPYREIECSNGCGIRQLLAKEEEEHLKNECIHRPQFCELCRNYCKLSEKPRHDAYLCPKRPVVCELGCGDTIPFSEVKKHELVCLYRLVACSNGCGEILPSIKMPFHQKGLCVLRKVSCPLKCTSLISYASIPQHTSNVCPFRPIECKWCHEPQKFIDLVAHEASCLYCGKLCSAGCGEVVPDIHMKTHLATSCTNRFVPCDLRCGQKVRVVDMSTHTENQCPNRIVFCPNECRDPEEPGVRKLLAKQVDVHLLVDCPHRHVACRFCSRPVEARQIDRHIEEECEHRIVSCRIPGCAKQLPLSDREAHELHDCKFRRILCENGCGEHVIVVNIRSHLAKHCSMRYVRCPLECGQSVRRANLYQHLWDLCDKRTRLYATPGVGTKRPTQSKMSSSSSFDSSGGDSDVISAGGGKSCDAVGKSQRRFTSMASSSNNRSTDKLLNGTTIAGLKSQASSSSLKLQRATTIRIESTLAPRPLMDSADAPSNPVEELITELIRQVDDGMWSLDSVGSSANLV